VNKNHLNNKKTQILVTGDKGLLGTAVVSCLRMDMRYEVTVFEGDITKEDDMKMYREENVPYDWVLHFAACTDVGRCEKDQAYCRMVNAEGTMRVRDIAEHHSARFLYMSTVSVFDGATGNYREHDMPYPKNNYNLSKLLGEHSALEYEKSVIVRSNLIGIHSEGNRGKNFFEWLFKSFSANEDMNLFTDVRMNPLSQWSLAENIIRLLDGDKQGRIIHFGTKDIVSKFEIALYLKECAFLSYLGKLTEVSVDDSGLQGGRPKEMWLNTEYAEKLGFVMPSWKEEVNKIIQKVKN